MLLESKIQARVLRFARSFGAAAYKLSCVGRRGFPDLLIAYKGRSMFMEVKAQRGRPTAAQNETVKALSDAGMSVVVVYGLDSAMVTVTNFFTELG